MFWRLTAGHTCQDNWFCHTVIKNQYCHNYLARKGWAEALLSGGFGQQQKSGTPHGLLCHCKPATSPSSWQEPKSKTAAAQVCPGPVGGCAFGRKREFSPFQLRGTSNKLFIELSRYVLALKPLTTKMKSKKNLSVKLHTQDMTHNHHQQHLGSL